MRATERAFAAIGAALAISSASALAAPAVLAGTAVASSSGGTWGTAHRISTPRTPPANPGNGITSVACAPKGYCVATGFYEIPRTGAIRAYLATEQNGTWSKPKLINTSALSFTPSPTASLAACPSAGNCVVIGTYPPFAVTEKNGTWGKAHGLGELGLGETQIYSLGCTSAGNCVAGGQFQDSAQGDNFAPFVVSEKNGIWGALEDLPGTSDLSIPGGNVDSISCTIKNTCLGIGSYTVGDPGNAVSHNFVAVAKNGVWGTAKPVPGLPADDIPEWVACSPDGTCTVLAGPLDGPQFTMTEKNGTWDITRHDIPPSDFMTQISCPSRVNCSGFGFYFDPVHGIDRPVVATELGGTWAVQSLPGLKLLTHHHTYQAQINAISCGAAGNCAATGAANVYVTATKVRTDAFVVSEVAGRWQRAQIVPGIVRLDRQGNSQGITVACWRANRCAAGGFFDFQGSMRPYPFVVLER